MLVIKVELHSARDGHVEELGRMIVANDGTSSRPDRGDYRVYLGRKGSDLNAAIVRNPQRRGEVKDYPRLSYSVWKLIALSLKAVGF